MIEFIRNWIIQVLVTVIFMVLVDMILPNNNFKKYAKLVTGLIIMVTILTPVFKLFDRSINVEEAISNYITSFQDKESNLKLEQIEGEVNRKTIETFKENLISAVEKSIYDETGENYIVTDITIDENTESYNFAEVKSIKLMKSASGGSVRAVDKIVIGNGSNTQEEAPIDKNVLKVLKKEFNINSDAVKFVK